MKKLFFAIAVLGMSLFAACGGNAEQDAAAEKARQEAVNDSIQKAKEAAEAEAAEAQDTTAAASEAAAQ
jgi:hypothetical protein